MTETALPQQSIWKSPKMRARLARRYRAERRFRRYGIAGIGFSVTALAVLLVSIISRGYPAFVQTEIRLEVYFDPAVLGDLATLSPPERQAAIVHADFPALVRNALLASFPEVRGRRQVRQLTGLASIGARSMLMDAVRETPGLIGQHRSFWVPASANVDQFIKGRISAATPESERKLTDQQIGWIRALAADGELRRVFNWRFLTSGDSREPELAGIWGAAIGSAYTLAITFLAAFPIGVATAVYLEEFAPRNRMTDLIEITINNLAAVPSIVFGLLGLALYLNVMHLPRSAPLVGGLTLALMTLPTLIITARAAIKAVPPSIREAAIGLGASPLQVASHHTLPLALPGILTGAIIGMARALGETAPLLMIGMVAFVVDLPHSVLDAATVLPVQVYLWADSPEQGFVEKTSAAIMVLLGFLAVMNGLAIWMRQKFEKRW